MASVTSLQRNHRAISLQSNGNDKRSWLKMSCTDNTDVGWHRTILNSTGNHWCRCQVPL